MNIKKIIGESVRCFYRANNCYQSSQVVEDFQEQLRTDRDNLN